MSFCCVVTLVARYLLASRMLMCGDGDSGSGTQSGWIRRNSCASCGFSAKQHGPTDGPTATTMSLAQQPNSVTMVSTVATATPCRVPLQPEKQEVHVSVTSHKIIIVGVLIIVDQKHLPACATAMTFDLGSANRMVMQSAPSAANTTPVWSVTMAS